MRLTRAAFFCYHINEINNLAMISEKSTLEQLAQQVRFVAIDGDGVLFDNNAWHGLSINGMSLKPKTRSHSDGQGISFLRAIGMRICIITSAHGIDALAAREVTERWNNLPSAREEGGWSEVSLFENTEGLAKEAILRHWLASHGGTFAECVAIGNDIGDGSMLKAVAFPCAPADAEQAVKDICSFITPRNGGEGALRDVANLILEARGISPFSLPTR